MLSTLDEDVLLIGKGLATLVNRESCDVTDVVRARKLAAEVSALDILTWVRLDALSIHTLEVSVYNLRLKFAGYPTTPARIRQLLPVPTSTTVSGSPAGAHETRKYARNVILFCSTVLTASSVAMLL